MADVLMGIGVPGAGKTTILQACMPRFVYISSDDLRKEMTGSEIDQSKNSEVWDELRSQLAHALQEGKDSIVDATFTNSVERKQFIRFAKEHGATHILGIYFDVPVEVAMERNQARDRFVPEHAIRRMRDELVNEPPSLDDGFTEIYRSEEFSQLMARYT